MDSGYASSVFLLIIFSQFSDGIEDRVVVGSLDLNQCRWLPDEIAGTKPEVSDVTNNAEFCILRKKNLNLMMYKLRCLESLSVI